METVWSFFDSLLESITEIGPLLNKFFSFWRGKELFVKLFKSMNLWGVSPSLKRSSHVSEWSSFLNFFPGGSNIIGFLLDGSLSFLGDLDLKHVSHIFRKIRNLNVFLDGPFKFLHLLFESLSGWRDLEFISCYLELASFFVFHELFDTIIVCFVPYTSVELLVLGINIIKLFTNLVQSLVGNMNTIRGLNNTFVKNSANILPLFDEPLSLWRGHEFSV
jgi:hypothetical protein